MTEQNRIANILVAIMLVFMFVIIFTSALNESAIQDELAHIPAGYSYVTLKDMRLNPEHPPLLKDLAGLALLAIRPHFPADTKAWSENINGQWDQGGEFLYHAGNDPDKMLRFARFPIMLLAILFGWLLFKWVRSVYGNKIALMTTFFYAFSPTFIAHSRYVTTDLGAAFGFFIGIAAFVRFLENPSRKRIIVAGIAFGIAELLKFSLFLLIPIYGALAVIWVFVSEYERTESSGKKEKIYSFAKEFMRIIGKIIIIGAIGIAIIWLVYLWHIWNYPPDRELRDAQNILSSFGFRPVVNLDLWFIGHKITRPIGQYLLGLLMVVQRAAGGNTAFYLGEVSNRGSISYFPVAYLLKETIPFHLLTLIALMLAIRKVLRSKNKTWADVFSWIKDNFVLTSSIFFVGFYWFYSMRAPLNIGVRHVLPTFPFIYLLVSRQIVLWTNRMSVDEPLNFGEWIKFLYRRFLEPIPKIFLISLLCFWIVISILAAYPFYLSYYNEAVGVENGYQYIVDSNYDWGQDLIRLKDEMEKIGISKIYLDYFGGGSPAYYFKDKFVPWWSAKGAPPSGSYFAVSSTLYEGSTGKIIVSDLIRKREDSYLWLKGLKPIARGGTSIFIFQIP